MGQKLAKARIVLDKRRKKSDSTYPLMLLIYFQKRRKYYSTGYSVNETNWIKINSVNDDTESVNVRGKNKLIKKAISGVLERAQTNINSMTYFSFPMFEEKQLKKSDVTPSTVIVDHFYDYVSILRNEGREKSAESYELAMKSLLRHGISSKAGFGDIGRNTLEKYEKDMLSKGRSWSTIGIYLRNLRRLYNRAISAGKITRDIYPFGKDKYVIPNSRNVKRALTMDQIRSLVEAPTDLYASQKYYRDMWVLSFLCKGANMKDIAHWKWEYIDSKNVLTFVRRKSRRTTKGDQTKVVIQLYDGAIDIINTWGTKDGDYIFDIIKVSDDEKTKEAKIRQHLKNLRKAIKHIANDIGLDPVPVFQTARHSWASIAKDSGVAMEDISEGLGHKSKTTTEAYITSFSKDKLEDFQKSISGLGKTYLKVV